MAHMNTIITMDERMFSLHAPRDEKSVKNMDKEAKPIPVKAKVQASRNKMMILAFFDSKGLEYMNVVPKVISVYACYILDTLGKFMKIFKKKAPAG